MDEISTLYAQAYAWAAAHPALLGGAMGLSVAVVVGSVLAAPALLARIDADYFVRTGPSPDAWRSRHPGLRAAVKILKNLLGLGLLLTGLVLLVLPGQGLLTVFAALMLLDFPGKRKLELSIVRRRGILKALNWIRGKAGAPPLRVPAVGGSLVDDGR